MEIRIENELYARSLGWEVLKYLRQEKNYLQTLHQEANMDALRVLEKIQCILNDDALDDPECFGRIELIVKEPLIKSTCADLHQKFPLTRKKSAGILTDFKLF